MELALTITEAAKSELLDLIEESVTAKYVRIFVEAIGCCGCLYGMSLEEDVEADDVTGNFSGIDFLVDDYSLEHVTGATVDYTEGPQGFQVTKTGTSTCSCSDAKPCDCGSDCKCKD